MILHMFDYTSLEHWHRYLLFFLLTISPSSQSSDTEPLPVHLEREVSPVIFSWNNSYWNIIELFLSCLLVVMEINYLLLALQQILDIVLKNSVFKPFLLFILSSLYWTYPVSLARLPRSCLWNILSVLRLPLGFSAASLPFSQRSGPTQ